MRELILLRHAHAEPATTGQSDLDRPLSPQGLAEAEAVARWLKEQGLVPDRVLCSPARRTRETLEAVLPLMRAQGAGVIVNLGSGAAHTPLEGWSHYCAAKAATLMLTRCAHLENRGRGIRVYSLSPGTVATDMQRKVKASGINPVSQMDFASHAPPEMPARALVWLCTDDAADLAGQEVSLRDPDIRARAGL